jgi:hypothetical protein
MAAAQTVVWGVKKGSTVMNIVKSGVTKIAEPLVDAVKPTP